MLSVKGLLLSAFVVLLFETAGQLADGYVSSLNTSQLPYCCRISQSYTWGSAWGSDVA